MSGGSFAFYRFSIILLLGNLAWTTRSNSLFVSKHATELIGPQFNSNIGRGEQTMYIGLTICFWYNLVAWILSILDSCVVLVYIGLIDLGIVAALIPAVYWQGTYIPHWKSVCQSAASWQVSNASDKSWFTVLAKLQKPADPDPKGCCEKYVETWIFTVVVIVLFSIFGILNIRSGTKNDLFTWCRLKRPWSTEMIQSKSFLRTLLKYLLLPFYIIWHFFVFPRTRAKWYFWYRYCVKVIYRHRGRRTPSTASLIQDNPQYEKNTIFRDKHSDRLSRLLMLDISTLVASNLHYTDIQSLSLTSSHIRETLFPTGNIRHHTAHFRLNSCNQAGKTRCWHCQLQICNGCGYERELRDTPTSLHLHACKPRCTMCYKDTISKFTGQSSCKCRPYLTKQMVCINCCKIPNEVLVTHRNARDQAKLERSLMRPVPCSHCRGDLEADGPRWWVCTKCERECANHIHPGWAPKSPV